MRLSRAVRSPTVFWAAAIALSALTGLALSDVVARAQAAAARYGSLREVLVATRPVHPGQVLGTEAVARRHVPAAFVPSGALSRLPPGRTVAVRIFPGEPVLAAKLAPEGLRGVAALLPPGTVAVAVPAGAAPAPVRGGDVVDVLASFDAALVADGEPTVTVAAGAVVVDVSDTTVTVAVQPEEAVPVAHAAANGVVSLALTSLPPPEWSGR